MSRSQCELYILSHSMFMVKFYLLYVIVLIKVLIFYFYFQWDGTECRGWYWEEEYAKHVAKATKANKAVSQLKKSVDAEQTIKHMSALVGIGREIIVLLKCILGFLCIALVVLAYAMWRL